MEISFTAIIILNYNNTPDTINLVNSILEFNTTPVKFVIVDNASTSEGAIEELKQALKLAFDNSFSVIKCDSETIDKIQDCTLILNDKNEGYARGNNVGLEYAEKFEEISDLLILNNDTLFIEDILPKLKKERDYLPRTALISPLLFCKDGEKIDYNCARSVYSNWEIILSIACVDRDPFGIISKISTKHKILLNNPDLLKTDSFEIGMPSGSCMLISKETMKKIGNFDPGTFLYYEENILQSKIREAGLNNYLVTKAHCIHLGASTTKSIPTIFLSLCRFNSACYYLENYANLTILENICFCLAKTLYKTKDFIRRQIRK